MCDVRPSGLKTRVFAPYLLAAAVVGLDLLSKRWAATQFADGPRQLISGILTLQFVENPGAAFGLLENAGPFLGVAAVVAVGYVSAALARPRPGHEVAALGLIMAGAVGNLIDRIARGTGFLDGKVIDWIDLKPIPTFNMADSAITVAVAILILGSWKRG
ncbi:MAG: signal peptidase II [Acidimicrobiia bacterium]|nr:signal peptidase II [Acidimicrobiia bacterium]